MSSREVFGVLGARPGLVSPAIALSRCSVLQPACVLRQIPERGSFFFWVKAIKSVNALMSFESFVAPNQIEAFYVHA